MKKYQGATLTETIIAAIIIAVLALVLWRLLDPPELIKKSRDTNTLAQANEISKSIQHYYVNYGFFPWNRGNENFLTPVRDTNRYYFYDAENPDSNFGWLSNLVTGSYLKETEVGDIIQENRLYVYKAVNSTEVYICFSPLSRYYREAAALSCNKAAEKEKNTPANYREFIACQSDDGTVLIPEETASRNLLCVVE